MAWACFSSSEFSCPPLESPFAAAAALPAPSFDAPSDALFDVLPARNGERTVRPALVRDGELVRRGVAAVAPMAKEV